MTHSSPISRRPTPRLRGRLTGTSALVLVVALASCSSGHSKATPTTTSSAPTTSSTASAPTTSSTVPTATTPTTTPASKSRALYPAYLPNGIPAAVLRIESGSSNTDGGYTQSYYGAPNAAGALPELVIEERPAGMGATGPGTIGGKPVEIWRSNSPTFPVIGVTAKVSGRDVTLIGYSLSESDIGAVLGGLAPKASGPGWNTAVLPAGLRLFGEGNRTPTASAPFYRLMFGPSHGPSVTISVTPGALLPEDTCACNPGGRRSLKASTVNGIPAIVIDRSNVEGVVGSDFDVDWQYGPDIVVDVSVFGFGEPEAMRIASSLTAANPATWSSLSCVDSARPSSPCTPEQAVPTSV